MIEEMMHLPVDEVTYKRFKKVSKMYGGDDAALQVVMKAHEAILSLDSKNGNKQELSEETDVWLNDFVSRYDKHENAFKMLGDLYNVGNAIILSAHLPMPHYDESKVLNLKATSVNEFVEKVKSYKL